MKIRMKRLLALIEETGLAGMVFNPGPTLTYLTGLNFHLMERPTLMFVLQTGLTAMILPELEKGKLKDTPIAMQHFSYGDDPATWQAAFDSAADYLNLASGQIGVEPIRLRFLELQYLHAALPGVEFVDAGESIASLRVIKDSAEVERMRQAAKIAQQALVETLSTLREGMSEKEIASELVIQLFRAGSDPELPFGPIVAIGENSANPHAVPSDRTLQKGDLLLIDWGAAFEGYFSDITRTFTFGQVDPELLKIGEIVMAANQAGRQAGKPGLEAGAVDRAARSVISAAGYGAEFFHRTGHGLGMEAHETPYIFKENATLLSPGMTFTVEPGIYITGKGGVRIEDDVVVTDSGLESLTDLPRQLLPIEDFIH